MFLDFTNVGKLTISEPSHAMAEREFSELYCHRHIILHLAYYDYDDINQSTVYFTEDLYFDDGAFISIKTIRAFI